MYHMYYFGHAKCKINASQAHYAVKSSVSNLRVRYEILFLKKSNRNVMQSGSITSWLMTLKSIL